MPPKILIVDDSPAMQAIIVRILAMAGFEVQGCARAANGLEALRNLRGAPFDLILADLNMPVMDGEEMVRAIRSDPRLASIPVVVVSTDSTDAEIRHMLDIGAQDYIAKPFTPEDLREVLAPFLGKVHA
jgi:two-component system chemotaxis response regulator CheY